MMRIFRYVFIVLAVCFLWGCAEEFSMDRSVEKEVLLSLSAAPLNHLSPDSKAVDEIIDEGLSAGYVISDFWIFQYNNQGLLVGKPSYYRTKGAASQPVSILLPSESGDQNGYTTVFLANTHNNSLDIKLEYSTLASLKESYETVASSTDLYQVGYNDLLMNGVVLVTADTESIECPLYRNVAKVDLKINNAESSGITITSVQFKNVNNKLYYLDSMYSGLPDFPNTSSVTFVDLEKDDLNLVPGQSSSLKYYLPRNMRGNVDAASEYGKNAVAPTYSTYIEVMAIHNVRHTPVRYRFYLGKNNDDSFDVEPNYLYDVTLNFNSMGTGEDLRVEDLSEVVFDDANSYIINPVADVGIKYTVPIKERINKFWESSQGRINPDWNNYMVNGANEWVAEVIWQDIDKQVIKFCMEDGSLTDTFVGGAHGESFSIVTTNEAVGSPCNVLIGVRSTKPDWDAFKDGYMWSWHIWITDYNPYSDEVKGWEQDKYSYQVTGGHLHKYASFDELTMYDGKFIMDRNLGSTMYKFTPYSGVTNDEVKAAVGLYYAYGRKDPFPGVGIYDINGTSKRFFDGENKPDGYGISLQFGPAAIHASVTKPFNFYKRRTNPNNNQDQDWVISNSLVSYDWNDLNKAARGSSSKSFFDPCPPGWMLPDEKVFMSMGYKDKVYAANCVDWDNPDLNNAGFSGYKGWLTYLSGKTGWESKSGDVAYFPSSNNRAHGNGEVLPTLNNNGGLWTANPAGNSAHYLYYDNSKGLFFHYDRNFHRYIGFPVRCIQE